MSNRLAIAAVTACLRNLLTNALTTDGDLSDAIVTAQPLDKARDPAATTNQLNIFLYMISPSAAWRNQDMPGRTRAGEVASPPLALNLFYLVSAYGRDNDVQLPFSQLLLAQAMGVLYDHPLLGHDEIAAALPGNDLGDQPERVRITLQPLSLEEISKLWAGFQMQYRLSVAYEVAVVLIDPSTGVRAAPPVLSRGAAGRGFPVGADPLGAYPRLSSLEPKTALHPGDEIVATGEGMTGGDATAVFSPWRGGETVEAPASARPGGGSYAIAVPGDGKLPAGPCLISLRVGAANDGRISNTLPLMIAPRITSAMPAKLSLRNPLLALDVEPPVLANQHAALILGEVEVVAKPRSRTVTRLEFDLVGAAHGTWLARLRVDGADSLIVLDPQSTAPRFDPNQTVEVVA